MDLAQFGNRIRQAREALGLSQEDFAAVVSKTQAAISDYENGRRRVSITDLPLFADVLQVPIMYFFEGELSTNDLDYVMLEVFHRLSDLSKQDAIKVVQILLEIEQRG